MVICSLALIPIGGYMVKYFVKYNVHYPPVPNDPLSPPPCGRRASSPSNPWWRPPCFQMRRQRGWRSWSWSSPEVQTKVSWWEHWQISMYPPMRIRVKEMLGKGWKVFAPYRTLFYRCDRQSHARNVGNCWRTQRYKILPRFPKTNLLTPHFQNILCSNFPGLVLGLFKILCILKS